MARVLITAPGNRPWSPGPHLVRGMAELGHEAELFDYRSVSSLADELAAALDAFRPDVHLLYKGETLTPALIADVRERGVYTIQWHCDVDEDMPAWLTGLALAHDAFFTQAGAMVPAFRALGVERAAWLSGAFDPTAHALGAITADDRTTYGSQVAFIGRLANHRIYDQRVAVVRRVLGEGLGLKWWGWPIPRKFRTAFARYGRVGRAYGGEYVSGESFAKVARLAQVVLGYDTRPDLEKTISSRTYWVCGCGGFCLTRHVEGMEAIFEPDREIVVFRDADEMIDKMRHYLAHDGQRAAIAAAGQRRVLDQYTYARRFEQMFATLRAWGAPV